MSSSKDLLEQRLEEEYAEALDAMRFADDQKARMAERIAAEASRSLARERSARANDSRKAASANVRARSLLRISPAAVAAALAICVILPAAALAASGNLKGFFEDVTSPGGAVVGTSYEQATDEIDVSASVEGAKLIVTAEFVDPKMPPYSESERLSIAEFQILDAGGNAVAEGSAESVEVSDGQAAIGIPLDGIAPGSYTLIVSSFVSEKKADQPLVISGSWRCDFSL